MGDGKFQEACVWRLLGFDFGGSKYGFEVAREGGTANLVINGRVAQRLPLAVWRALADAIDLQREARSERSGSAWSPEEDQSLLRAHSERRPVDEIAHDLRRSRGAILARFDKLGVFDPLPVPKADDHQAPAAAKPDDVVIGGSASHPVTYLQPKEPSRPFRAA